MITVRGTELKECMIRNGFTGAGLARATGISKGYVCQMINGKRNILPPTAKKICDALGCSFDDVFTISKGRRAG